MRDVCRELRLAAIVEYSLHLLERSGYATLEGVLIEVLLHLEFVIRKQCEAQGRPETKHREECIARNSKAHEAMPKVRLINNQRDPHSRRKASQVAPTQMRPTRMEIGWRTGAANQTGVPLAAQKCPAAQDEPARVECMTANDVTSKRTKGQLLRGARQWCLIGGDAKQRQACDSHLLRHLNFIPGQSLHS